MTMALGGLILGAATAVQAVAAARASMRCIAGLYMVCCCVCYWDNAGDSSVGGELGGGSVMGRMLEFCQMYRL